MSISICVCVCMFYCGKWSWYFQHVLLRFRYASPASPNLCFKNVTSDTAADFIAPHGPAYSLRRVCVCVETKGKYLWLPQPPIINPSFPPSPWGGTFQRSAVCHTVPEATLQERLLNPENQRCEYKSCTSHLCFWEKKTHPPVAPISLTFWIAHCAADYWFCFRPACVIAPESRLVIPAVKAINFMLAREHNLSVSHPTVWCSECRHLHKRVSYPKHKLCLY